MSESFTYKVSNGKFNFYRNKEDLGIIQFHLEYNQITIGWLCIKPGNIKTLELYHRRGYGTHMLKLFEKYVIKNYPSVSSIVLIPEYFDGINKNGLCAFYEKSDYYQEKYGYPYYIKKLVILGPYVYKN